METTLKIGDQVRWNAEAGVVSGVIVNKITFDTELKGYTHHAPKTMPQYLIKSDKTNPVAVLKATALRLVALDRANSLRDFGNLRRCQPKIGSLGSQTPQSNLCEALGQSPSSAVVLRW
jgi:Hypervirulence associated proteins TUDOR domain